MTEAIVMDGGKRGHIVKVCPDPACLVHRPDAPSPQQVERERAAERKRIQREKLSITTRHRILATVLQRVSAPLKKLDLQLIAQYLVEHLSYNQVPVLAKRHKVEVKKDSSSAHELLAKQVGIRDQILVSTDPEVFEKEVHKLVAELKTSHTGFRHAGMRNIPARHAINATLHPFGLNGSERWMFQDVHQGGPAFAAGIRPGDLLLACGGREVLPPNDLIFSVGESASLLIEKLHGEVQKVNVQLPMPKSQKHPVTAPQPVTSERLSDEIGLLRVAMFPGAIGIDVAKDIDRGISALDGCSRLIVDLRGNTGGGIGGLRLMSYLTPGKLEVGYSLTRKRRERGYRREELTRFGRIPSHKATLMWLAPRYAFVEKSILVVTEGLGQRRFHGRVVLLVNEHTASAGEMVSAFAEENNLATIVGTKTPGRLLSGSAYKVGHGYILGLPVAAYLTWTGRMLENNGIVPKFSIELSRDALMEGRDTQLETAIEVAQAL
jgi:carboxyl-terminal processing protease